LKVNRDIRRENDAKIREVCQKSEDRMLWSEAFHQLTNSKVEANFADHRTYVYRGEEIDQAYHLGFDLAVTKNYPVEAANNGTVAFTGDLGIYGNTVILDHGYGLFTLYSHMSSIGVETGKSVKRKEPLGKTGQTGLATGDHLHYTTLIYGVPVLPLEWWDSKWVKENVFAKLRDVSGGMASRPGG
jgi:murein DD-endopeptidase MepM/ murein hydrolase activator NlpD